ncbi:MAG: hypothetical protein IIA87_01440 [Nanoarchaeota archaeon]|nr:hypothetical protein [Nanoarchaeota archaeon]
MVEKDIILKEDVRYSGFGNFKKSYEYAHDWLKGELFRITEDSYNEKLTGNEKEIEVKWIASKKITDYFRITLRIRWKILKMTDVEVEIDGKKEEMNKFQEIKIEIKGVLEKDYSTKWQPSPIYRFFKEVYHKYIIPSRTLEKEDQVREIVQDFKDEMKAFFDLTARRAKSSY